MLKDTCDDRIAPLTMTHLVLPELKEQPRPGPPPGLLCTSRAPDARDGSIGQHVPALDGIRGVAILTVMLFHMAMVPPVGAMASVWASVAHFGGLGVDVFFVLSGFLITGILLEARGKPRYFLNFYARRVLRIFPLYYAVVFLSLVFLPRAMPWTLAKFGTVNRDGVWYWFHLSNFAIARRGAFVHGILDVSWSLAIEEQFYLIWPTIVLFGSRTALRGICLSLVVVSCLARIILLIHHTNPIAVYTLTFCRLDGLAIGALLAMCARGDELNFLSRHLFALSGAALGITSFLFACTWGRFDRPIAGSLLFTSISLLAACAIVAILTDPTSGIARVFSWAWLRALGRYSYAMYLFHYPLAALLRERLLRRLAHLLWGSSLPLQLAFDLAGIGLAFAAAVASWHCYEKWFLKLKRYF